MCATVAKRSSLDIENQWNHLLGALFCRVIINTYGNNKIFIMSFFFAIIDIAWVLLLTIHLDGNHCNRSVIWVEKKEIVRALVCVQ